MITVKTENYNHISQDFYNELIGSLELSLIPCPCGHIGCLIRYGSYARKVQLEDELLSLNIFRVYCTVCKHTHALLLSSMVPYSQIPLEVQVKAIQSYESHRGIRQVLCDHCYIDESNLRSILRRYRLHWRERIRSLSLALTDLQALTCQCFAHFSRQFMQIRTTRNKLFLLPT